jgi:hypothetical protein
VQKSTFCLTVRCRHKWNISRKGQAMDRPALTATARVAWELTCAATIVYSMRETEWRIDVAQIPVEHGG